MLVFLLSITILAAATFVCSLVSATHQWANDASICEILYHKSGGLPAETDKILQGLEARLRFVESSQGRDWRTIRWLSGTSIVLGVTGLFHWKKKTMTPPTLRRD
jgi:hypothetical protein